MLEEGLSTTLESFYLMLEEVRCGWDMHYTHVRTTSASLAIVI
jgi:hypothetical protein